MSLRKSPKLTAALLAANRRNAQRSTGPRTPGGKARARLNRLRHGHRSPLFKSFRTALAENPYDARSVSRSLLRPEESRHPLFALWIREWGRLWTNYHAHLLAGKRRLKRLRRLALQLQLAASREAGTGGGFEGWPMKLSSAEGLGDRDRRQFASRKVENNRKGYPPTPQDTNEAGMLAKNKGDAKRAVGGGRGLTEIADMSFIMNMLATKKGLTVPPEATIFEKMRDLTRKWRDLRFTTY